MLFESDRKRVSTRHFFGLGQTLPCGIESSIKSTDRPMAHSILLYMCGYEHCSEEIQPSGYLEWKGLEGLDCWGIHYDVGRLATICTKWIYVVESDKAGVDGCKLCY